eukprot:TRINITY_DN5480_c0_g1_i1.p1 TRINITY_DN5480_c0_g1~~TRINITY_DN5480_c0_g1_i1.p1  ORF type:complete len:238 (-),score=38.24 TRINITY_DN5480_c0_g1_i1:78-764(-)
MEPRVTSRTSPGLLPRWRELTNAWGARAMLVGTIIGLGGFLMLGRTIASPPNDSNILLYSVFLYLIHIIVAACGCVAGWKRRLLLASLFVWTLGADFVLFAFLNLLTFSIERFWDPVETAVLFGQLAVYVVAMYVAKTLQLVLRMWEFTNSERYLTHVQGDEMAKFEVDEATLNVLATQLSVPFRDAVAACERWKDVDLAAAWIVLQRLAAPELGAASAHKRGQRDLV